MTGDFIQELARIQRYAAGLLGLLNQAQAQAPRAAEGADSSGAVRVQLGPGGFPESVRVESGWERRLRPEAFGAAVGEAFQAAMGERLAAWTTTLQDAGWQRDFDRLRHGATGGSTSGGVNGGNGVPPALRRPAAPLRPRSMDQLAEDMIKAFDNIDQFTAPPAERAPATGAATGGKLTVTLSRTGGMTCTAEPRWVAEQSAAKLMNAVGEALAAAKAELARTASSAQAAAPGAARLDGLLAEAMAYLSDPRRLADSGR